jgi:FtsP/CotA-like multicopper oxidase with cupredoxin domain
MHLHHVPQLVVAKDGFPLDWPYWADTVNIAPGERYGVLVMPTANDIGVWAWRAHPHAREAKRPALLRWSLPSSWRRSSSTAQPVVSPRQQVAG